MPGISVEGGGQEEGEEIMGVSEFRLFQEKCERQIRAQILRLSGAV